jgi:hypothetical protein
MKISISIKIIEIRIKGLYVKDAECMHETQPRFFFESCFTNFHDQE